jgi:hypothetical protein
VTPQGNAYRVALPAGTVITFPASTGHLEAARAVAVNETSPDGDRALRLTAELQLVSPAYIAERDAAEVRYVRRIIELEARLNPTK